MLTAGDNHAVLLVFQAMDAAGKDSTIRSVMQGVNPAGCQVFTFKKPSSLELDHDFLWRTTCDCRSAAASVFSIAASTKKCWSYACTRKFSSYQKLPDAT